MVEEGSPVLVWIVVGIVSVIVLYLIIRYFILPISGMYVPFEEQVGKVGSEIGW